VTLINTLDLERATLCSAERSDVPNSCGVGVRTSKACPYKIKMSSGVRLDKPGLNWFLFGLVTSAQDSEQLKKQGDHFEYYLFTTAV